LNEDEKIIEELEYSPPSPFWLALFELCMLNCVPKIKRSAILTNKRLFYVERANHSAEEFRLKKKFFFIFFFNKLNN
jgi:hypothetical protein